MGIIFMIIGNVFILKPSPSSSARDREAAKEDQIDFFGDGRRREERRGEERREEERRGEERE